MPFAARERIPAPHTYFADDSAGAQSCTVATEGVTIMNVLLRIAAVNVLCAIGAMTAGHAQSVTCQNAQYDPAVLAKYPNLPKSCLDVVMRDGEEYAVVKAKLDRVTSSGSVVIRPKMPDGSYAERRTVKTPSNLKVLIDGKPARVQDLAEDQELTAYVKVSEPVMALAPADESTPLALTPLEEVEPEQERMAATLPSTSSALPLLGLMGGAFLLLGGLLSAIRFRR
jgi:hypothetical protein